jgi:hypothetical protein
MKCGSVVLAGVTLLGSGVAHASDGSVQRAAFAALDGEYGRELPIYGEKWNVYRARVQSLDGGVEVSGEMDKERNNWFDDGIDYKIRIENGNVVSSELTYDDNSLDAMLWGAVRPAYEWCRDNSGRCRDFIVGIGTAILGLEMEGARREDAEAWARLYAWAENLPEGNDHEEAYKIVAHIAVEAYRRSLVTPLMYGVDLPGGDVQWLELMDHEGVFECRLACAQRPDCTSFSYRGRMSLDWAPDCWLKTGRASEVNADSREHYIISGRVR